MDLKINISLFLGGRKGKDLRQEMLDEEAKRMKKQVIAELNKPKVKVDRG